MSQQSSHASWIGHTISGRYKIESLLGQGGMSSVYKATDPNLRRPVAIKLIHPHLSSDPEFVRRFEQEAAAVAQLRHQNIIQVFDFNHDGDVYYMVLEFLPGETLQQKLATLNKRNQRLPLEDSVDIMAKICDAVAYAHTQGMIHRDLKPANVMLDPNDQPVLMDFGVAKMLGTAQHTATGAIIGTAKYMSPEQARGDRPDERTDIYSLGIMLYEMVTGATPFEGESTVAILMKHVTEEPPDIRRINASIPEGLAQVIEKALSKDRNARYQRAADMAAALRSPNLLSAAVPMPSPADTLLDNEATIMQAAPAAKPAPPAAVPAATPAPPPPATQKSGLPIWIIGAAALVLLLMVGGVIGIFALTRSGDDTTPTPTAEEAVAQTGPTATQPAQESILVEEATATSAAPEPAATNTATPPDATPTEPTEAPAVTADSSASDALPAATQPAPPPTEETAATNTPEPTEPPQSPTPQPPPPQAPPPPAPDGMVFAPAGFFQMGSTAGPADEQPRHPVLLDGFFIDRTEVTNAQYRECVTAGGCTPANAVDSFTRPGYRDDPAFDNFPVVGITWDQAQAYCRSVGKRLPTEAEWEYAAAGPNSLTYPWGNSFNVSLSAAGSPDTEPVDSFPGGASPFGVLNMAGNVAEWVADAPGSYANHPPRDPLAAGGDERVFRGGSFANPDGEFYRTSKRYTAARSFSEVDVGVRCVQDVPVAAAPPPLVEQFCAIYANFNSDRACP